MSKFRLGLCKSLCLLQVPSPCLTAALNSKLHGTCTVTCPALTWEWLSLTLPNWYHELNTWDMDRPSGSFGDSARVWLRSLDCRQGFVVVGTGSWLG